MDEYIAVYLYDVKQAIEEVESFFVGYPMRYEVFEKDTFAEVRLRGKQK